MGGDDAVTLPLWGEALEEASRTSLGDTFSLTLEPGVSQHAALDALRDLQHQDGGSLTNAEVLEVMAAWSRQAAAAEAQVRAWAAVLAARPSLSPSWRTAGGRRVEAAADEIGFRLGVSRRRGQQLIEEGRLLGDVLSPVDDELSAGRIDAGKASILAEALGDQEPHVALAVCEQVLPVAPSLDHAGLRRRVQQVIHQVDPGEADARHERAVLRRRVNRVRVLPDGMASFSALLAAPDAVALEQACEAAARAARAGGDGRTLENLRADALASMGARALTDGWLPMLPLEAIRVVRPRRGRSRRRRSADPVPMPMPMPMSVPTPVPGRVPLMSGPTVSAKAVPVTFSGRSADLSVIATAAVQQGRDGATTLGDVARHDLYAWERDPWDVVEVARAEGDPPVFDPVRPHLVAPDPAERLPQGLDPGNDPYVDWSTPPVMRPGIDAPELVGYGAVSPAVVRSLMGAAPWVRVTEPVYRDAEPPPSVDSYRPSAELDRHVRVRDVTCVVPGCHVPAARCDVDHLVPWPAGPTAADNLHALCRRHHLLRTHAGHELVVAPDGTRRWRTPLGQTLWSTPDGVIGRENDGRSTGKADPSTRPRTALPGTSRAGVARWGRTRAVPRLRDSEVDRRLRDLDDAEADDPAVDDLWPVGVSAAPRSAA
ncbi:hypothetical protein SERN_0168 [Serinibacter arcticus]|uniref:HNH nuclease domain-containing protein n=1 Tax=Serinibacter arcticus TaxID=1655435 RepID=A0A4Z1E258_9MICO|nr:hypothetical protein SERN_0168 [Serinibacter arcticus]